MLIVEIEFTHNSKYFRTLNFFNVFRVNFILREDGSSPKLANFRDVCIGFELV
jgi:hypothetical protein